MLVGESLGHGSWMIMRVEVFLIVAWGTEIVDSLVNEVPKELDLS